VITVRIKASELVWGRPKYVAPNEEYAVLPDRQIVIRRIWEPDGGVYCLVALLTPEEAEKLRSYDPSKALLPPPTTDGWSDAHLEIV
jgi:hypothetical protein